jgi:hypothetical protein
VDAHTAQNTVWGEFGQERYASAAQKQGGSLDQTAAFNSEEKLYNHLANTYVQDYINKDDKGAARGMINDYVAYALAHTTAPFNSIARADLETLKSNAQSLVGAKGQQAVPQLRRGAAERLQQPRASLHPVGAVGVASSRQEGAAPLFQQSFRP